MKSKYLRNCLLLLTPSIPLSIESQTTTPPMAEPSPEFRKAHPAREDGELQLSISPNPLSAAVGKDMLLNIDLKNTSAEPFRFHFTFAHNQAELNGFVVKVKNSAGEEVPLMTQEPARGFRSRSSFELQSGQVLHDHLIVNHLVDMSQLGTYKIHVRWKYRKSEKWIDSNEITAAVTAE
jgi:hypothetical protein